MNNPNDIAVTEDEIYVVEESNHRIQVFDKNGTFLRKWGQHGSNNGDFHHPYSIALKMDGNRVEESLLQIGITMRLRFLMKMELSEKDREHGYQDHQIYDATGVAIGPDEKVYISSLHHNKVKVFEMGPMFDHLILQATLTTWLFTVMRSRLVSMGITEFKSLTKMALITTLGTGSNSDNPGEFYHPWGLSYAPNGNLHVVDIYNNRVQVFDSNHSFLESYRV